MQARGSGAIPLPYAWPPGQGASPEAIGSLNRDSNTGYPAKISRTGSSVGVRKGARAEGGCTPTVTPFGTSRTRLPTRDGRLADLLCESSIGSRRCASPTRRLERQRCSFLIMAERGLEVAWVSALRNGAKPVLGEDLVRCFGVLLPVMARTDPPWASQQSQAEHQIPCNPRIASPGP